MSELFHVQTFQFLILHKKEMSIALEFIFLVSGTCPRMTFNSLTVPYISDQVVYLLRRPYSFVNHHLQFKT
jgi:hypothetical protein